MGVYKTRTKGLTIKWALVVSLLWAQVAIAEHGHEHAIDDLAHVCEICQHFDSGDCGLPDAAPARATPPAVLSAQWAGVAIESPKPFRHYSARASP